MTAVAHQVHGEFILDAPGSPDDGEARTAPPGSAP
jgi:hypothetical protein